MAGRTLGDNEVSGHMIADVMHIGYTTFVNTHSPKMRRVAKGVYDKKAAEAYINGLRTQAHKAPLDFGKVIGWDKPKIRAQEVEHRKTHKPDDVHSPIKSFHVEDLLHGGIAVRFEMQGYTAVDFLSHFSRMLNPPVNVELKREDGVI